MKKNGRRLLKQRLKNIAHGRLLEDFVSYTLLRDNYLSLFIVLFCLSKKEPKKDTDKRLHPVCWAVP